MSKLKLTQAEIDKLETVGRVESNRRVYGAGVNTVDFEVVVEGDHIWQYRMWKSMIRRCFSEKLKARQSAYKDVTCCDEWLSFANFFSWVNREVDYMGRPVGFELDKDILMRGNKTYSPEACSFVPQPVNKLLMGSGAVRGDFPVGVCFHNLVGKFVVQLSVDGKQKTLGYYNNPEDAFAAYKVAKEAQIKVVALRHKDVLKPAVFESLMNWEIGIGD